MTWTNTGLRVTFIIHSTLRFSNIELIGQILAVLKGQIMTEWVGILVKKLLTFYR